MTRTQTATILFTAMLAIPAAGFAAKQSTTPAKPATAPATTATRPATSPASTSAALHTLHGVVKSVDATRLIVTEPKRGLLPGKDVTVMIDSSTERQGTVSVGEKVMVRYRAEKGSNLAAAITVEPAKVSAKTSSHAAKPMD